MSTRRDYRKGLFSPAEIAFAQAAEAQYNEAPQGAFFFALELLQHFIRELFHRHEVG
jgi:hypothetical protein